MKRITLLDGLGKTIRNTIEDSSSTIFTKVDTQYDGVGRISQVSLPYTGSAASYWSQTQYDGLGRVTKQIPADGSASANNTSFTYSGNTVIKTDNAGNQVKQIVDGMGRRIEVDEPDPTNGNSLTLVTTYLYDPLGNNTQITQGAQTRTFVFDGLSRKTSETTPEAGTVNYVYNSYSLLSTRTDARGVVTTNTYDPSLNRLSQIVYTTTGTTAQATPSVNYTYGTSTASYNNGRLITMTDGVGSENYSYDLLGRRTQLQKVVNNVTYTVGYTYNLDSGIATMTYPSGRVVKRNYDTVGRPQSVQNNATSTNYASGMTYNADNELTGLTFGNGVVESISYTAQRYQLNSIGYTNSGTTLFGVTYGYTQNGGNTGQITSITDSVDAGRTVNYTFDALHRLSTAVTNGSTNYPKWGLSWTYDRYGNRTAQTVTAGSAFSGSPTVSASTNRITALGSASFTYDSSGNLTQDDLYNYVYDAENRMVQLQQLSGTVIATYSFDGNSLRVIKVQPAAPSPNRVYSIYDGTDLISEFSDTSTTTYTSGTTPQQAPADSISLMLYQFSDQLTTRMSADNFASNASYEGHYPFGETWYDTGMAYPSVTKKFTSYNRDVESTTGFLDYAVFRQHSARLGRFHMADPIRGKTSNPQSLNRYSYGFGDPINNIDPKGLTNFKVYIPPDWPCDPDSVVCGCDPFGPFGTGFTPSVPGDDDSGGGCTLGGGGGSGIQSPPHECQIKPVPSDPSIHICRGTKWTAGLGFVGPGLVKGSGKVTKLQISAEGHGEIDGDEAVTQTTGPATNYGLGNNWVVPYQFVKPGKKGNSAFIMWHYSYSCEGTDYNLSVLATVMYCE
jgi:RHS repeat-associated protein